MELGKFFELFGIGLLAGTWGSLIGAGGGFIIVPLLLFIDRTLIPSVVTAISLVAVFANGVSGTTAYARLKRIDYKTGAIFLVATLPSGVAGALVVNYLELDLFEIVFGILLIIVALYVFIKPRKRNNIKIMHTGMPRQLTDIDGERYEYSVNLFKGVPIVFFVGFLAGMLGVGGGIFNVPAFVILLGIPIQIATATSQFILVGTSLVANITNLIEGDLSGYWPAALALSAGTLIGGQLGARLSQKFDYIWLTRALSFALLIVGIRLVQDGLISL